MCIRFAEEQQCRWIAKERVVVESSLVNKIDPLRGSLGNKQNHGTDVFVSVVTVDQIGEDFVTSSKIDLN